jgi:hypothetical protein
MNVREFKENTRKMFSSVMEYIAAIADSWESNYPENHERVSALSACVLQCTRDDLSEVANKVAIDGAVPIVTLVIDCTTDLRSFHFAKECKVMVVGDDQEEDDEQRGGRNHGAEAFADWEGPVYAGARNLLALARRASSASGAQSVVLRRIRRELLQKKK